MTIMNAKERDARIKQLEGFRDDWQASIDDNDAKLQKLMDLKLNGINVFDEAIARTADAGNNLRRAKANIEQTISRVRAGGN